MNRMKINWVGIALVGSLVGCGGEGEVGDTCSREGAEEGECVAEAICGPSDVEEGLFCLEICQEQADCPANHDCNGLSGSNIKGCRPKADGDGKKK